MNIEPVIYTPIGVIHSPFDEPVGVPIQPTFSDAVGTVEVFDGFADGLKDLDGFSHIILLYHFHKSCGYRLLVQPFLDDIFHGVFATRAPRRPNPIGLSVVELLRIEGNILHVRNIDILDDTPLLDIKPHIDTFDKIDNPRFGWITELRNSPTRRQSDGRFAVE